MSNTQLPFFFVGESTLAAGLDSEGASIEDGLGTWSASNIDEVWGASRGSSGSWAEAASLSCLHGALGLGFTMVQIVSSTVASFSTSLMRLSSLGMTLKWVFSDGVIVAVLGWQSYLSLLLTCKYELFKNAHLEGQSSQHTWKLHSRPHCSLRQLKALSHMNRSISVFTKLNSTWDLNDFLPRNGSFSTLFPHCEQLKSLWTSSCPLSRAQQANLHQLS